MFWSKDYGLKYYGSIFYPYYFLLGALGLYHLTYGLLRASDFFLHTRIHRSFKFSSKNFALYMAAGTSAKLCVNFNLAQHLLFRLSDSGVLASGLSRLLFQRQLAALNFGALTLPSLDFKHNPRHQRVYAIQ